MRITLLFILTLTSAFAQKKLFDLEDAMNFQKITFNYLSDDGKWLIYQTRPDRGNAEFLIRSTENEVEFSFERGTNPAFSSNMETVAFTVEPDIIAKANDKENELSDTLYIFDLEKNKTEKIPGATKYKVSNDGKWISYFNKNIEKNILNLREINSMTDIIIKDVKESVFDSTSKYLFYIKDSDEKVSNGIYFRDLTQNYVPEQLIELDTNAVFDQLSWNTKKNVLAYKKSTLDSNDEKTDFDIKVWDSKNNSIINAVFSKEFENWFIPEKNRLEWTEDGERLWFGLKPETERYKDKEKDKKFTDESFYNFDSLLKDTEMYMWHHDDDRIITEKRTKWNSTKDRTYEAIFHLKSKRAIRLADTNLTSVERTNNNLYTLAYDVNPYEKRITWDYWYYDLYLVDLFSGERTLIAEELITAGHLSPLNRSVVYFKDNHWWSYDISTKTRQNLTDIFEDTKFYNEENDRPRESMPYGFAAWYKDKNRFLVYDKYDIWEFDAASGSSQCVTQAEGRISNLRFRLKMMDQEFYIDEKIRFIELFDFKTKKQDLFIITNKIRRKDLIEPNYSKFVAKSENNEKILYTKERYDLYPDIWVTDSVFSYQKQLTDLHPEIKDYNWGKTELIEYENSVGDTLMGYYITPDDFDASKKYPLFVYFYEKFSQRRHRFITPQINHRPIYPWYVGQGYCMFFPDIRFRIGRPGDSGLDAVMSGIRKLAQKGFIDTTKVALHGHSWSGYQSAYFVTQTDFFAACVTGAPVSNMTSAYSGIRLGSGLARQFQYEKTQSRIGGTLIDSLDAYIENSPVFYADKMNTPMLIMFGDRDDAVPWEQGVELFLACRRFGKPAIFLQYEDEPHHLKKYPNKLDYTIKMKEFFDHYVLGKEPADWIINGAEYRGTYNTGN